jgi:hypothetical protein
MPYLWSWSPWHRYSNWGVRRHAKKDGKLGIPTIDQSLNPPFVMQLKNVGDQGVKQFEEEYHRRDARMLADYCRLKREEETLKQAIKKPTGELDKAKEDELAARRQYAKHFHVGALTYWFVMLLILAGEFVLNTVVFKILGDDKDKTMLAALGVGIAVPWLGHALGGQFRHGFLENGKVGRHAVSIIAILLAVVAGFGAISYLREKFFEGSHIDSILGIHMDPTAVTVAFIALNTLLFVAAAIASYLHHDPEAMGNIVDRKHASKTQRLTGRKVNTLERRLAQVTAELAQVAAERSKLYERTGQDIGDWRDHTQRLMSVYHEHNLQARGGGDMPRCFGSYPPIDVSTLFDSPSPNKLIWDCKGVLVDGARPESGGNGGRSVEDMATGTPELAAPLPSGSDANEPTQS